MIDKIIEVFTKPQMELTAIDKFIQSITTLIIIILISVVYITVKEFIENRKDKRK